jgi:hypothetical protein
MNSIHIENNMSHIVIVGAARTAVGPFNGAFAKASST